LGPEAPNRSNGEPFRQLKLIRLGAKRGNDVVHGGDRFESSRGRGCLTSIDIVELAPIAGGVEGIGDSYSGYIAREAPPPSPPPPTHTHTHTHMRRPLSR
jgi:hypothetical protein